MKRRTLRSFAASAAVIAVAGCGDSDDASTAAPTSETSTSTPVAAGESVPPGEQPALDVLVEGIGDPVASCCEGEGQKVTFTLVGDSQGALAREAVDERQPADLRRGLTDPEYRSAPNGAGGVYLGSTADEKTARFDCNGYTYTLSMGETPDAEMVTAAVAVAAAAGCEKPSAPAPTECLGLPSDPAGCAEGEGDPDQ